MVAEQVRTEAIDALEGMRQIARREMLITGQYIENTITNPRRVGSLCGGRKHCAIGSLWVGAGVKPRKRRGTLYLPGTGQDNRTKFLRTRPGLRLAYDSLNEAAVEFAVDNGLRVQGSPFTAPIEAVFEGHYGSLLSKRDMLSIIAAAKRKVRAA